MDFPRTERVSRERNVWTDDRCDKTCFPAEPSRGSLEPLNLPPPPVSVNKELFNYNSQSVLESELPALAFLVPHPSEIILPQTL